MINTGAARAWRFLKRNPRYIADWRTLRDTPPAPLEAARFPVRVQTPADHAAAAWGLLAWENPLDPNGPRSPFWADAPMPEGVPASQGAPALTALLRKSGARPSGLRLPGGALVLKIERGDADRQVRIADGDAFDADAGLMLRLPFGLDLLVQLNHIRDLWFAAGIDTGDAAPPPPRDRRRRAVGRPRRHSRRQVSPAHRCRSVRRGGGRRRVA